MPNLSQKIKIATFFAIVILAGFGFAGNASAAYYSSGNWTSTNLLTGETVTSIDSFVYNLSAKPANTTATVGFNQDSGSTWYNAAGNAGTETLVTGSNQTITLTSGWSGANFHYKVTFTSSDGVDTPVLDDISVNFTSNQAPVASSVSIDSAAASVTLTENTTKNVVCTATVTDDDGYANITTVAAKLYRSGVGAGGSDDNDNHYTLSGNKETYCTGSGTSGTCTFTFGVYFYADPTDAGSTYEADNWTCQVTPSDGVGAGTAATDTIEMDSLTALNVTATIAYGALALNANTGASDQTTTVTNTGNRLMDAQVDGYGAIDTDGKAMTCTIGNFALSYERYSTAASTDWSTKTQLTDTAATITNFDLAKGAASTKNIYWGLGLPASGVGGSCSGKVNFTAAISVPWACGDTLTDDRDSKTYATVLIGSQCWMAQHINYGTITAGANNQGSDCPSVAATEKYCYSDTEGNCTTDGALYQWAQAMCGAASCNGTGASPDDACASPVQGICPAGWHIPSHFEYVTLERAVCTSGTCVTDFPYDITTTGGRGTNEGTNLKVGGSSGFEGLLAGYRHTNGSFVNPDSYAIIWSSLESGSNAWSRYLYLDNALVSRYTLLKTYGFSLRCLQD